MPRQARIKGMFSTYHIILRGNEGKDIFFSNADREAFISILQKVRVKYNFKLYAYCLMRNHVHLIIFDNGNDISEIMKSLNTSFAIYINKKYRRRGHLLQDRFRSEIIDSDIYLLVASKYIHNNPVKAGLCQTAGEFSWSSFNIYCGRAPNPDQLINTARILSWVSHNQEKSRQEYCRFVTAQDFPLPLREIEDAEMLVHQRRLESFEGTYMINSPVEAKSWLQKYMEDNSLSDKDLQNPCLRNSLIRKIRRESALTQKEIGELFGGLCAATVSKIINQ